ncbi:PREDICTED: 28S ribosomal protein S30, mitochondrial-like [Priapulus caudatus]|uniref:28S ribosomal protein S30, mitochondrial-like n=1 Tax=Priapulus caudatus TaxID=37621 RepID=A0ABM1F9Z6_PRICU|nr:PREDICTED: 28S ribosomal protein S30, mitochondrial-like [Priapulus caudatus]
MAAPTQTMSKVFFTNISKILLRRDVFRHVRVQYLRTSERSEIAQESEYTDEPQYPSLEPVLLNTKDPAHVAYQQKLWIDQLRGKPTVQDKLDFIRWRPKDAWREIRPKMKDQRAPEVWKHCPYLFRLHPINRVVNFLPYQQYITRTTLVNRLPELYNSMDVEPQVEQIKTLFKEALITEELRYRHDARLAAQKPGAVTCSVLDQLVGLVMQACGSKHDHLLTAKVDNETRQEAFWFVGGFPKREEKGGHLQTKYGMAFQYKAKPWYLIRTRDALPQIVSRDDTLSTEAEVPECKYHPVAVGMTFYRDEFSMVPGFKDGDTNAFGLVQFHECCEQTRDLTERFGAKEVEKLWLGHGIISSFSWLLSQAFYQGFDHFNDITYPLITQSVITNGQYWQFFTYQLNSTQASTYGTSYYRNICWAGERMKLYDCIEDDQVKGFNDDVLRWCLKFMLREPLLRNIERNPYISTSQTGETH